MTAQIMLDFFALFMGVAVAHSFIAGIRTGNA
jgi:hypothetical protein